MSAIAGFFNRDSAPVQPAFLSRMLDAVAHRGRHGRGEWAETPVALGHLLLATTPDSSADRQPLRDSRLGVSLVFDGRVDDRERLRADLARCGVVPEGASDAALVLAAYACWGEGCFVRILGDFAVAIWDGRDRRLVCARDVFGIKPFFYSVSSSLFAFGSELRQVLEHPAVPSVPNEGMVAEYLACAETNPETLYRSVSVLPAAHYLVVDAESVRIEPYWDIDFGRSIRYARDEDYLAHFLELFEAAVSDRLRASSRIAVSLSGGLDSSAVVGMSQHLLRRSATNPGLMAFTHTFPGLAVDESRYVEHVTKAWNVESRLLPFGESFRVAPPWGEQARKNRSLPDDPFTSMHDLLCSRAAEEGVGVLLAGTGSDAWLGGSRYPHFDLIRAGEWGRLWSELRFQSRERNAPYAVRLLLRSLLWPLLPAALRLRVESRRSRGERTRFLGPSFAERVGLDERLHRGDCAERFNHLAKMETYRAVRRRQLWSTHEVEDRAEARHGVEQRHPFLDRRLAEFAMAVADPVLRRADQDKYLLRLATSIVPEEIRRRQDGGEFSIWLKHALSFPEVGEVFGSLAIAKEGWVDGTTAKEAHRRVVDHYRRSEPGQEGDLQALWMVFAVEMWHRHGLDG